MIPNFPRYLSWNDKVDAPFANVVYLGHPKATDFSGRGLAHDLVLFLEDMGYGINDLQRKLVAGCFDGQYLHLR